MIDGLKYKFIDTDGIRLLPKEFDIQRLFQNEIISGKSIDEILNYWNSFYSNYHNNIDIKYKYCYLVKFCIVICNCKVLSLMYMIGLQLVHFF